MRTLQDHLFGTGPKRILSLDGGGVRGLITLGLLQQVEDILKERSPDRDAFRLADYFDLIGGTSTGGIIATLLALRYRVAEICEIYRAFCPSVFHRTARRAVTSFAGLRYSEFDVAAFERNIDGVLADYMRREGLDGRVADLQLDTDKLSTGLGIVMKRIDTCSVWVLTNNPRMKYWDPNSPHWSDEEDKTYFPNGKYALRDLARATASAPFYLDAVDIGISPRDRGLFLDGGASPFNNPALELFLMTTLKQYDAQGRIDPQRPFSPFGFDWETGEHQLLLYSVGTGTFRSTHDCDVFKRSLNMTKARHALCGIIDDSMKSSLIWCQALSEPASPVRVDGNLKEMRGLRITPQKFMTFKRVDPYLDRIWSERELEIDLLGGKLHKVRSLDNATRKNLDLLQSIGKAAAPRLVSADDFPAEFEPVYGV